MRAERLTVWPHAIKLIDMSTDVTRAVDGIPQPGEDLSDLVAEEIRALMGRRRISGAELARRLGVSQMWVSYRLNGKQAIDLNDLARIARVLRVEPSDLLPRGGANGSSRGTPFAKPHHAAGRPPTRSDGRPGSIRPRRLTPPLAA